MTAAGLIVLSVACLAAAVVGAILVTWLDIRMERRLARQWLHMPGAVFADDVDEQCGELLTLATKWARDDWEDDEGRDVIETEPLFGLPRDWSRKA